MTNEELDEAILTLTGRKEWTEYFHKLLEAENAAAVQNELDAPNWDEVMYQRGYRAALGFVANIREVTKALIEQLDADL